MECPKWNEIVLFYHMNYDRNSKNKLTVQQIKYKIEGVSKENTFIVLLSTEYIQRMYSEVIL